MFKGWWLNKKCKINRQKSDNSLCVKFTDYKEINPQSSLTESELKAYQESGDAIEKHLLMALSE